MLIRSSKLPTRIGFWIAMGCFGWLAMFAAMSPTLLTVAAPPTKVDTTSAEPKPNIPTIPQVEKINAEIRKVWEDSGLKASPYASDNEWCRRVYLDLIGRIPSFQELNAFVSNKSANRRAELVQQLLYGDDYVEEYARNWTTVWTTILIGRTGGTERNSLINREGMQKYLRDSFARNKPYDKFVYDLVTATGHNTPGQPGFNGAVNFLTGKLEEQGAQATAMTAKIFLGTQVQCTQCHNHPFNEWKQKKFWEMNAFFRQTKALRAFVPGTNNVTGVNLQNEDFAGEGGGNADDAEIYYQLRNGLTKVAYPTFIDGTEISHSGYLSDVNRRVELGKLMVGSPYLSQAIVNRMWGHFLGHGFTKPVDDMGPHNLPTHPELLTYLADELKTNSYNLKELMRWIVLSEPYALSSRSIAGNKADDPSLGEKPKFTHFYLRQMTAEELYESLLVATQAHKTKGSFEEVEKQKSEWLQQFVTAFGTDEGDEATNFNGSIPQVLMMFNGDLIKKATDVSPGSFLHTISTSNLSAAQRIDYLFMAGLQRKPSANELQVANALLASRKGDVTAALQDIWWVVLNSNEFIMNH